MIHAREQSWVSTTVDGKSTASELLEAGTERTVHATKEVTVKGGQLRRRRFAFEWKAP